MGPIKLDGVFETIFGLGVATGAAAATGLYFAYTYCTRDRQRQPHRENLDHVEHRDRDEDYKDPMTRQRYRT